MEALAKVEAEAAEGPAVPEEVARSGEEALVALEEEVVVG